jgi:hypothetical protein
MNHWENFELICIQTVFFLSRDRDTHTKQEIKLRIFLFTTASRTALGPTQPSIQWVPEDISLGVKQPGHEADH